MGRQLILWVALFVLAAEGTCFAQQPLCVPGTPLCARANGNGGVQAGGTVQGRVGPNGATVNGNANANANANANGNANGSGNVSGGGNVTGGGSANGSGNANGNSNASGRGDGNSGGIGYASGDGNGSYEQRGYSEPIRWGAGLLLCGTVKAGVYSGLKIGPCFAVSFRTERITFEMETQLLVGGVRHSVDWVFPMSFVIPLTTQRSLYEGLQLRVGGSPIGATFAKARDGGNYIRFGLHAGLSYEWGLSGAVTWRVFDIRSFLDFGTKREVDLHDDFLDFGGQFSTGIVF